MQYASSPHEDENRSDDIIVPPTDVLPLRERMADLPPKALPPPMSAAPLREFQTDTYSIQFTDDVNQVLTELAEGRRSLAEVLCDAIALSKWFKDTYESGATILIEHEGHFQKVIRRGY